MVNHRAAVCCLLFANFLNGEVHAGTERLTVPTRQGDLVQHEVLGVVFGLEGVFAPSSLAASTVLTAFRVTLSYREPGVRTLEKWITAQMIPNISGESRTWGPFTNVRGVHYRITGSISEDGDLGGVEFTLESNNLGRERAYRENFANPAFLLHLGKIRYDGVLELKAAWQVYSNVSFAYGAVRLAQGAVRPEVFLVQVAVEYVIGEIISRIPDHYVGAVALTCTFCGYRGDLEEISGCKEVVCPQCGFNRARICLRRLAAEK